MFSLYFYVIVSKDGPNAAQSGDQGEGRDKEDDQAEDGKTTSQRRREPPGLGKQETDDNGRH